MDDGWKSWDGHNRPNKYGRPPQPSGSWHSAVPQWEKRFCTSVCKVPWGRICAAKASMSAHKNVVDWDDSAALEAFQNAKACYWAEINGFPCDIRLPDPDIYVDKVDYEAVIDPKLVEDLEKMAPPPPDGEDDKKITWDSLYANKPVTVTAEGRSIHDVNWDAFLDKQTSPDQATGWGNAEFHKPSNAGLGDVWNYNAGWEDGTVEYCSWGGCGNYNPWTKVRDTSWGRSDNLNTDQQGRRYGRKRNQGHSGLRFSKSRIQMNENQSNNDNWRGHRERSIANYPYEKTMHAGQPMAVRQNKSNHSFGPKFKRSAESGGGAW